MSAPFFKQLLGLLLRQISLRTVLVVPFVFQIVTAVGLVGYLSFRNGQQAVNNIAFQLCGEISDRIDQELGTFFNIPHLINRNNEAAINLGQIQVNDQEGLRRYFWQQLRIFTSVIDMGMGNPQGEMIAVSSRENKTGTVRIADATTNYNLNIYAVDGSGEPATLLRAIPNFDPRQRLWYQEAVKSRSSTWTQIFAGLVSGDNLTINATHPVYNQQGNLEAVLGVAE